MNGGQKVIIWLLLGMLAYIPHAYAATQAQRVSLESFEGGATVTLTLNGIPKTHIFQLEHPDRLVIDLDNTVSTPSLKTLHITHPMFASMRLGIQSGTNLRIVFDLSRPVTLTPMVFSKTDDGVVQGVLTLKTRYESKPPDSPKEEKKEAPTDHEKILSDEVQRELDRLKDTAVHQPVLSLTAPTVPMPVLKPPVASVSAPAVLPLIIIDPGHGGNDPGASGRTGKVEKDLTLQYAIQLREILLAKHKYRVLLTREKDVYKPLRDRVLVAKKHQGDLFISLHADAHNDPEMRGLSVYTLSEQASDKEAAVLAAKANKEDVIQGVALSSNSQDVADVLIDLVQRDTKNKSAKLAEILVKEFGSSVRLLPHAHRFAGFRVLTAPEVPSVLIELGYLSHKREEYLLHTSEYKTLLTMAIGEAVDQYFSGQ